MEKKVEIQSQVCKFKLKIKTYLNDEINKLDEKLVTQSVTIKRYNIRNLKYEQINNYLYIDIKKVA